MTTGFIAFGAAAPIAAGFAAPAIGRSVSVAAPGVTDGTVGGCVVAADVDGNVKGAFGDGVGSAVAVPGATHLGCCEATGFADTKKPYPTVITPKTTITPAFFQRS